MSDYIIIEMGGYTAVFPDRNSLVFLSMKYQQTSADPGILHVMPTGIIPDAGK
jgi:hypothetical protein